MNIHLQYAHYQKAILSVIFSTNIDTDRFFIYSKIHLWDSGISQKPHIITVPEFSMCRNKEGLEGGINDILQELRNPDGCRLEFLP